jgi:hypothetical protein
MKRRGFPLQRCWLLNKGEAVTYGPQERTLQAENKGMISLESHLLGYNFVHAIKNQPTFRWNNLLHLQGQKINQARKQREVGSKQS